MIRCATFRAAHPLNATAGYIGREQIDFPLPLAISVTQAGLSASMDDINLSRVLSESIDAWRQPFLVIGTDTDVITLGTAPRTAGNTSRENRPGASL